MHGERKVSHEPSIPGVAIYPLWTECTNFVHYRRGTADSVLQYGFQIGLGFWRRTDADVPVGVRPLHPGRHGEDRVQIPGPKRAPFGQGFAWATIRVPSWRPSPPGSNSRKEQKQREEHGASRSHQTTKGAVPGEDTGSHQRDCHQCHGRRQHPAWTSTGVHMQFDTFSDQQGGRLAVDAKSRDELHRSPEGVYSPQASRRVLQISPRVA